MKHIILPSFLTALVFGFLTLHLSAAAEEQEIVNAKESRIEEANLREGDYGHFRIHTRGETAMTVRSFSGICTVNPGKAAHPAHRHAEEEYLVIMEGSGVWTLDGVESPAKQGDVLYVEPWVFHGLTNTGDTDLLFFVVKYHPKDTPLPPAPKGSHGS
jgi:mannose-6-phosphate isomerase-like protein (cupin superfamily)